MKSYEVLRQAFKPVGCKHVAAELGCSLSLVHQWTRGRDGRSEARNPLDAVRALLEITRDPRLVEWLCAQAGGRFVRGPALRALVCRECEQKIAELKSLMQLEAGQEKQGRRKSALGSDPCRFRRANGHAGAAVEKHFQKSA